MKRLGIATVLAYVGTVVAANWAINRFGVVPVGFGLLAPAGVYFAGAAFSLRDIGQELLGRRWIVGAILVGAGLSYYVGSGRIALASGVAFLLSEGADFAVYTPLRRRGWLKAVVASNIVGLAVDSWLFLMIAFGSTAFFWGQVWGKAWLTAATIAVVWTARGGMRLRAA